MRVYRYPAKALVGDYLRGAVGLGIGTGLLIAAPLSVPTLGVGGGLVLLFGVFGVRTLARNLARVAITGETLRRSGLGTRVLAWNDLERVKLRYYGTRRQDKDGGGGFMQLTLKGPGASFTFESSMDGFRYIAWRAAKALRDNGRSIDPTSAGNLLAIGLDADGEEPPAEEGPAEEGPAD